MKHTLFWGAVALAWLALLAAAGVAQEGFYLRVPDNVFVEGTATVEVRLVNNTGEEKVVDQATLIAPDDFAYRFEQVPASLPPRSLRVARLILTPPQHYAGTTQAVTLVVYAEGTASTAQTRVHVRAPPPPPADTNAETLQPTSPAADLNKLFAALQNTGLFFLHAGQETPWLDAALALAVLVLLVFLLKKILG